MAALILALLLAPATEPDLTRKEFTVKEWKLECVKPAGLARIDPAKFDASEKANGVVLKFDGVREHCRCMVRIYAHKKRLGIDKMAEQRIEDFRKRFKQGQRRAPELDKKFKLKRAKRTLRLRLMGRRSVREVSLWHFAEFRSGRIYQLEIYLSGMKGETVWKKQVEELVKGFTVSG